MCYYCHKLKKNPNSPQHSIIKCQDPNNPFFLHSHGNKQIYSCRPKAFPKFCFDCNLMTPHIKRLNVKINKLVDYCMIHT